MNAQLVLDATNIDSSVSLIVNEHRKSATIRRAFFRTSQNQMNVSVSISDEPLHAIQPPAIFSLIECCFKLHPLQVGTGIRLSEIHRHGLAGADSWNIFLSLLVIAECIESLYAILQRPHVVKPGIGSGNQLGSHGVGRHRHIQPSVAARHGDPVHPSLYHGIQILLGALSISYAAILAMSLLDVHALGIGIDHVGGYLSYDFKNLIVRIKRILVVLRSVIEFILVGVAAFFQEADSLHEGIPQMESQFIIICIKISHLEFYLL